MKFLFYTAFVTFSLVGAQLNVTLPDGTILGHTLTTFTNRSYYGFQGIPYAKPPIGSLRFQAPEPPNKWTSTIEATKDSPYCYQLTADSPHENEDCLYINVFTPILNANSNSTKVPVIFWIYGGGFRAGAATFEGYRPEYFMDEDVILVTHNYRVGPFGFLSTGDTVVPGNAGLKDQLLALKWTKQNIHLFGGDPEKITIYGQSAGSASVGYHLLSKQSSGLFRAAIAESGSPLNMWTYLDTAKEYVVDLAQVINANISSNATSEYLKEFLQEADAKLIDTASTKTKIYQPAITIEPNYDGAFLTKQMYEIFASGDFNKVPVLIGINSEERISEITSMSSLKQSAELYDKYPENLVPTYFNTETNKGDVGKAIKEVYVGNDTFTNHLGPLVRTWNGTPKTKPTRYKASGRNIQSVDSKCIDVIIGTKALGATDAERVGHAEELRYIFTSNPLNKLDKGDALTHKRLITMWIAFVKNLNPTPTEDGTLGIPIWPQVVEGYYKYLNINDTLTIETDPKQKYYKGWEAIFDKYSPRPYATF